MFHQKDIKRILRLEFLAQEYSKQKLKSILICGEKVGSFQQKNIIQLILNRNLKLKLYNYFMLVNIIYILIFLIFSFLTYLIIKSIIRGVDWKKNKKK